MSRLYGNLAWIARIKAKSSIKTDTEAVNIWNRDDNDHKSQNRTAELDHKSNKMTLNLKSNRINSQSFNYRSAVRAVMGENCRILQVE